MSLSNIGKLWLSILAAFFALFVIFAILDVTGLAWQSYMSPKRESIRRQVWEESKSYREGMRQDLMKYMYEYNMAESENAKNIIAETVRLQFAGFKMEENEHQELKDFLHECLTRKKGQEK